MLATVSRHLLTTTHMDERTFWNWVLDNKESLKNFIESDSDNYNLYNELTRKLHEYSDKIFIELTIDLQGNIVVILTSDGMKTGIPFVENLCRMAPNIEGLHIQKYRKPGHVKELNFDGLYLKPNDFKITYMKAHENEPFDVTIYIRGYKRNDERYKSLAFLYLDHFLGEYMVMTEIGQVSFEGFNYFIRVKNSVSLQNFKLILNRQVN